MILQMILLLLPLLPAAVNGSVKIRATQTITRTISQTTTITEFYRAGLVLLNDLHISGTDAYKKEFNVVNEANLSFANADLNVFAIRTDATCLVITTVILPS
jgi:hypothetical protein